MISKSCYFQIMEKSLWKGMKTARTINVYESHNTERRKPILKKYDLAYMKFNIRCNKASFQKWFSIWWTSKNIQVITISTQVVIWEECREVLVIRKGKAQRGFLDCWQLISWSRWWMHGNSLSNDLLCLTLTFTFSALFCIYGFFTI